MNYSVSAIISFKDFVIGPWGKCSVFNLKSTTWNICPPGPCSDWLALSIRSNTRIFNFDKIVRPQCEVRNNTFSSLSRCDWWFHAEHLIPSSKEVIHVKLLHHMHIWTTGVFANSVEPDYQNNESHHKAPERAPFIETCFVQAIICGWWRLVTCIGRAWFVKRPLSLVSCSIIIHIIVNLV